jgi:hypothetical protein
MSRVWHCPHCPALFEFKGQASIHIQEVHVEDLPALLRRIVELLETLADCPNHKEAS